MRWDLHDDYPLAPEEMEVNNVEKLQGNLFPKYHYVIHGRNLKQYLILEIRVSQNLAKLAGRPIKCQGWKGEIIGVNWVAWEGVIQPRL